MSHAARRTYVIDTSVLLSDPHALRRFAEHDVVLPIVVITELEAKRHHSELGYFARTALRHLDDLRVTHGRLDAPIPVNDEGGTVIVERIFAYPGIGGYMFSSIGTRDYPALQGSFLVLTLGVVTMNLLVDLLYRRIDPRTAM